MKKLTIRESISWGGFDDSETLQDVLASIQGAAPSIVITLVEASPKHSGGWPLFDLTFSESEVNAIAELLELDENDIIERAEQRN
jgi:hypothetical protein